MQEFFDSIPQDQWRTSDPSFIKQSEEFASNFKIQRMDNRTDYINGNNWIIIIIKDNTNFFLTKH